MKSLSEMSHYEILEIGPEASSEEVERAYRLACSTWGEDSLASYSLYGEEEAEAIRERVELAYRVLSDPAQRSAYDAECSEAASAAGSSRRAPSPDPTAPGDPSERSVELALQLDDSPLPMEPVAPPDRVAPEIETFDDVEEEAEGAWDGGRLRRARLRRGIDLGRIASVTKINPTYLRFLEEECFEDLPAKVYVRGFVVAYARCLGLDPERVVSSYLERFSQAGPGSRLRRSRRGGRP